MAQSVQSRRTWRATRRLGWAAAAAGNAVMLYVVNVWPGWQVLPFLTDDTTDVLGLFNLALAVGVLVNLAKAAIDRPGVRAAGDLASTVAGLVATVRIWQVFPFDFSDWWFDATVVVRVLLVIAISGAVIGILVQLGQWLRTAAAGRDHSRPPDST